MGPCPTCVSSCSLLLFKCTCCCTESYTLPCISPSLLVVDLQILLACGSTTPREGFISLGSRGNPFKNFPAVDNNPCYVKHHSPCATPRSRMVNGMNFTTSPPSMSRCHRRHLRPSVLSSLHHHYAWQFLLQTFLHFLKALRGSFKLNPIYSQMDIVFSTVMCLSPEWHTVSKCFTPGFQLKSKYLERNCHHIPT